MATAPLGPGLPARPALPAGLPVTRRDERHLQVGLDPPRRVVLPEHPDVRRLLADLATGCAPRELGPVAREALDALGRAGLLTDLDRLEERARGRAATRVGLDAPADLHPGLVRALRALGLEAAAAAPDATVVLVAADGQVSRDRVDQLLREGVPHLVLACAVDAVTVGPFVAPGATACLRCVDAHHAVTDPRRALLVEQATTSAVPRHPAVHPVGLAWAAGDLLAWAEGRTPATWSATVRVGEDLDVRRTAWTRHPGCGCAWGAALAG